MSRRVVWNTDELIQKISPRVENKIHSMEGGKSRIRSSKALKTPTMVRSCINYFHEFTENTSLHGLKYIGEQDRSLTERIWWAIMFTLSLITCAYLILNVWNKWQTIPVIVSFDEKPTPIWKMAFPAITVCSESKSMQSVFNYTKYFHIKDDNMTTTERENYDAISLVCSTDETEGNLTTDQSTIDIIKKLSPPFRLTLNICEWLSKFVNCSDMFQPVLIDEGLCYTFNMLDASEIFRKETMYENSTHGFNKTSGWNLHGGYATGTPLDTYPRRAMGFGALKGLTISLAISNDDLDYICRGPVQGFRISLHTPSELPRASQDFIRIPPGQEILVGIKPNMMTTSHGLKNYHPKKRHCYFPAERHLKYYKKYTKQNCDLECLSNYTLHVCECVSFFMPRDSSMKICSTGSTICVNNAEEELLIRGIKSEMAALEISVNESDRGRQIRLAKETVASRCDCLLACTSISYETETSQINFDWTKTYEAYLQSTEISVILKEKLNFAKATIFFKQPEFIKSLRSELYGQTDFLANCGGLLGLCLGFSVLSLIEIVYFITLRLVCNLTNKRKIKASTKKNIGYLVD